MDFNINDLYFYSNVKPDAETLKGKRPYGFCCEPVADVFRGLIQFNPNRDEFNLFRDSFEGHPFTDLPSIREKLPEVLNEIFERAALLRPDLQAYFLSEMEKEILRATAGNETVSKSRMAFIQQFPKRKAELIKEQTVPAKVGEVEQMPFFAQGSILAGLGEGEREALSFRQGIINRGAAYHLAWNDHKELFGDTNLSEEQFILADIDLCKREIEKWRGEDHSFKRLWIPILEMSIRTHEARLVEIRKGAKPQPQPVLPTFEKGFEALEKLKDQAKEYLKILTGNNPQGQKIMSDHDFQRLSGYVDGLIESECLPVNIKPISQIDFPNGHIRYLFYLIHKELYTTKKIKGYFIDFLHAVFEQFAKAEKRTTKTKFSVKPGSWERDIQVMNR